MSSLLLHHRRLVRSIYPRIMEYCIEEMMLSGTLVLESAYLSCFWLHTVFDIGSLVA